MSHKTRSVYSTGKSQDDTKCFKGSQCKNYKKKCSLCYRIQGKYTEWNPKLWTDRFKPHKPFLKVIEERHGKADKNDMQ